MRLIDAEDVKALINGLDSLPFEEEVDDLVDRIPTAYDVDKVVSKMETEIEENQDASLSEYRAGLYKVIEVVKAGGIDVYKQKKGN